MQRTKENTWRKLNNQPLLRPMRDVVANLTGYVKTYPDQHGYEEYTDELFIDDILYGLGKSLDEEYEWADGFSRFKERLLKQLQEEHDAKQARR